MARNPTMRRALELKAGLVDYALDPRFESALARVLEQAVDAHSVVEDDDVTSAIETLLYGPRPDGRPPLIEHYLRRHPDLPPADRSLLQDWFDHGLFGVFAVEGRRGDCLALTNVIDEMTYEVVVSAGGAVAGEVARGRWAATRVLPVGEEWLQSGMTQVFSDGDADLVGELVLDLVRLEPAGAFRNPDKLERAKNLMSCMHRVFCDMFDGVLTVGTGAQVAERHARFVAACEAEDPVLRGRWTLESLVADELAFRRDQSDVAMGHHPVESTVLLTAFGAVDDLHALGGSAISDHGRRLLLDYLDDESVPAWVLQELARLHPGTVDALYTVVLDRPDFRWTRDGEALLREHKPNSFVDTDVPDLLELPAVAEAVMRRALTS